MRVVIDGLMDDLRELALLIGGRPVRLPDFERTECLVL
jgi:hypothetical protein